MVLTTPAEEAVMSLDGKKIFYQDRKGYEDPWRKHHTSSIARDVWSYDVESGEHKQLTQFSGEDRNPVPGRDANIYYLSESSGSFNVHRLDANGNSSQLTTFADHPVRFLTIDKSGVRCFGYNGEVYIQKPDESPQKVSVRILSNRQNKAREIVSISEGITEMTLSPNGKEVAYVVRGEVFVAAVDKGGTKRITNTPTQERSVSFSPDGKSLLYAGEREGSWNVYQNRLMRPEEKFFYNATVLEESPVLASDREEFQPAFSPDGKEVAYLEERTTLKVKNLESGDIRTILPGDRNYSYSDGDQWYHWSPDGKWFLVQFLPDNHWISEVGLVSSQGGELTNLTNSGYGDGYPRWMGEGEMMVWFSERDGMKNHASWGSEADVYGLFFTQEAYDRFQLSEADYALLTEGEEKGSEEISEDEVPEVQIDWNGLKYRKVRLTIHSSRLQDAVLSPDQDKLYYTARFEKGYDLWQTDLRSKETKILTKLNAEETSSLTMDEEGKHLFVLVDGKIKKVDVSGGDQKPIQTNAEMELQKSGELAYIFEHAWRQVKKKFYVKDLHGVDWDFYKSAYSKFLPHITNNWDFSEMLSEMLGELNASHTGCRYRPEQKNMDQTASLGLFFDDTENNGLRVAEVLKNGPFDRAESELAAGVFIEKIDGVPVNLSTNHYALLNRKAEENVLVALYDPKKKKRWEEVVTPISLSAEYNLLYQRWVDNRREEVTQASDGRIGYVHVRGMNDNSYRTVFEEVLGLNANKESLIVDTRSNGGGWLHDDLATFLNGKQYIQMVPRGQKVGFEPQRKWTKPTALLMGESNYSDAHMFPYAYSVMNLGTTVGMPVPGTGTAVWWERQIDRTLVFGIPQVGMLDVEGDLLENKQLVPDVRVKNSYEKLVLGQDEQLRKAVSLLMQKERTQPSDTRIDAIEKGQ